MDLTSQKKSVSLLIITVNYIIAFLIGWIILATIQFSHPLISLFVADIVATLIVFIGSMIFGNASVYDPYWSVAPLVFIPFWFWHIHDNPITLFSHGYFRPMIVTIVVILWGVRLTLNWFREFTGFNYEDWRYRNYRQNNPKLFWVINLTGIQLFPTILVFLGSISLFPAITSLGPRINFLDIIGLGIALTAIVIETLADNQMWKYRKSRQKEYNIIHYGLWKYSRHPNYFGEISFWWGLYFFALGVSITNWWMVVGPLSITLLFVFISIPMIEKRQKKFKPEYLDYIKTVPKLIPWIKKSSN